MKNSVPAASPEAYVNALMGWQRPVVVRIRAAVGGLPRLGASDCRIGAGF